MSSRESILAAVKAAQPSLLPQPNETEITVQQGDLKKFATILQSIGGRVLEIDESVDIAPTVVDLFPEAKRIISTIKDVKEYSFFTEANFKHQSLHDVDVAIVEARLAVAENGAVWVTESDVQLRVVPFICQHLVVVINASSLVNTMHEAYEVIGDADYGFGTFIAGPSKTADIEQSLVLGAHGPKSMTVLVVDTSY